MIAARSVAAILGTPLVFVAVWMVFAPGGWFHAFPGVTLSGPFNPHLVRDLGIAFGIAGAGLVWSALRPLGALPIVLAASAFLVGHAGIHVAETISGPSGHHGVAADALTVYAPAALALVCALLWRRHAGRLTTHRTG